MTVALFQAYLLFVSVCGGIVSYVVLTRCLPIVKQATTS